jgi:hypothetical protein
MGAGLACPAVAGIRSAGRFGIGLTGKALGLHLGDMLRQLVGFFALGCSVELGVLLG